MNNLVSPTALVIKRLNPKNYVLSSPIDANLQRLAELYLQICKLYGSNPRINSGFRSLADQTDLYQRLGKPAKLGSAHTFGAAMDLSDVDGQLFAFLSQPEKLLELGIYLEAKSATPGWVHVQFTPPHSGKRIFFP